MFCDDIDFELITSHEGYVVLPGFVLNDNVELIRREVFSVLENSDEAWLDRNSARTREGEYLVVRSIDTPSIWLFECARHKTLITLAERFSRKRVTPLYVEFFDKPAFSNAPSPLHQDHAFYNLHFPDELGITFWIALDDCDPSNGCMHVMPTANRVLLPHTPSQSCGFAYEMVDQNLAGLIPIPLRAGDVLVHGSFTPHYCPPNLSSGRRMAIAISFRTSAYREQMSPWK